MIELSRHISKRDLTAPHSNRDEVQNVGCFVNHVRAITRGSEFSSFFDQLCLEQVLVAHKPFAVRTLIIATQLMSNTLLKSREPRQVAKA
jgi:hypothetical protein